MTSKTKMKDFKYTEKYGNANQKFTYVKPPDQDILVRIPNKSEAQAKHLKDFFQEAFLPQGYPESVSVDYFNYQLFDTIQAFCSRITGTIATKAVLKGVGVGDANATPLAAAITWIFKDGTGMIGSIVFAWWKGSEFDTDCKKWRLFADVLNDAAMFVELFAPSIPVNMCVPLLCLSTVMKAAVGVAGSATRAAITQHQAIRSNSADVAAKDGSQETVVNLVASVVGLVFLTAFSHERYDWYLFGVFVVLHVYANYLAVKSLVFNTLNTERYNVVLSTYFKTETIPSTAQANEMESAVLGLGLKAKDICGYDIRMGVSLQTFLRTVSYTQFQKLKDLYKNEKYLIASDPVSGTIDVVLCDDSVLYRAYFHAMLIGLSSSITNKYQIKYFEDHDPTQSCLLRRLRTKLQSDVITLQLVDAEFGAFFGKLRAGGWHTDLHSILADQWRLDL